MKTIFQHADEMDLGSLQRCSDLLAFFVSNNDYRWPWKRWERALEVKLLASYCMSHTCHGSCLWRVGHRRTLLHRLPPGFATDQIARRPVDTAWLCAMAAGLVQTSFSFQHLDLLR